MYKLKNKKWICAFLFTTLLVTPALYAADSLEGHGALLKEIERLRALKQTDPAAYQSFIESKKASVQHRYQALKKGDPEKFQKFVSEDRGKKRERLKNLKQNDPQAFEQFVQNRQKRFERMKQKNPEAYQRLKEKRPALFERNPKRKNNNEEPRVFREQRMSFNGENEQKKAFQSDIHENKKVPRMSFDRHGDFQNKPDPQTFGQREDFLKEEFKEKRKEHLNAGLGQGDEPQGRGPQKTPRFAFSREHAAAAGLKQGEKEPGSRQIRNRQASANSLSPRMGMREHQVNQKKSQVQKKVNSANALKRQAKE